MYFFASLKNTFLRSRRKEKVSLPTKEGTKFFTIGKEKVPGKRLLMGEIFSSFKERQLPHALKNKNDVLFREKEGQSYRIALRKKCKSHFWGTN